MTTTTADLPDLDGFETHYGMKVASSGEDGDLVMLGHHQPLRAIAAMNAYSRRVIGLTNMADARWGWVDDLIRNPDGSARLRWLWMVDGVALGSCLDHQEEPDEDGCSDCYEIRVTHFHRGGWYMLNTTEATPGAFPVTLWAA